VTLCLLPLALVLTVGATAPASFRAELKAGLRSVEFAYGPGATFGEGGIYRGEPLLIELRLDSVSSGSAVEADWLSRMRLEFGPGGYRYGDRGQVVACAGVEAPTRLAREVESFVVPTHGIKVRCNLGLLGKSTASGPYHVTIGWDDSIDRDRFRGMAGRVLAVVEFELKDVKTEADVLDRDYRVGVRAFFDGNPHDALRIADEILARHPTSLPAHLMRIRVRRELGDIKGAEEDRERAAVIAEQGLDPYHVTAASPTRGRQIAESLRNPSGSFCGVGY